MNGQSNSLSIIAFVCALWFTLSSVYLQIIRTDLDVVSDALSLYAIGASGFILETGFYSIGLTQILLASIFVKNKFSRKYSITALFLAGVGVVIVGVIPTHIEPVDFIVKLPHVVGATMQFLFFPIAILLLYEKMHAGGLRYYTILTGVFTGLVFFMILVLFVISSNIDIRFFGLVEKVDIYAINFWLLVMSWKLSRRAGFRLVFITADDKNVRGGSIM